MSGPIPCRASHPPSAIGWMGKLDQTKNYDRSHGSERRSGDVFSKIRKPHSGKLGLGVGREGKKERERKGKSPYHYIAS